MTRRERNLWLLAAGLVALIYSTLSLVRGPIELLRNRGQLELAVGLVFLAAGLVLVWLLWRRRPGPRELGVLLVFGALLLWFVWRTERPEERLHLLEYGALAALVYLALCERATAHGRTPGMGVALTAIAVTGLCGWIDEAIQYLLPNRVYDLRDVALNLIAAILATGALHAMEIARRRERPPGAS